MADAIRKLGGTAEVFKADVRDEAQVKAMVASVEQKLGPVNILVCNATGPQPFVRLEELTWEHCLDQLEFFVKSPILLAKAVVPGMKAEEIGPDHPDRLGGLRDGSPPVLELRPGQGSPASA